MDDYYENIETFLNSTKKKLFVYPTLGGRIEWVVSGNIILGIENNYIRCGWNSSRGEVLNESFLSDEELKTFHLGYKFIPPRECTVENCIKALKKLDNITLCGMLIVRLTDRVFFFHSYNAYQATVAVRKWFNAILQNNPNITLEQLHVLVEQNKGGESSQILLTRTWIDLLQNCPRDCGTDEEIIQHVKKQINS